MSKVKIVLENIGMFRGRKEFKLSKGLNVVYAPNASGKTSLIVGLKVIATPILSAEELRRVLNDYENKGKVTLVLDENEYTVELVRKSDGSVEAWGNRLSENGIIKRVAFADLENELVSAIFSGDNERAKQILRELSGAGYLETVVNVVEGLLRDYEYSYEIKSKEYESKRGEIELQIKDVENRLNIVRKKILEIHRDPKIEPIRKEISEVTEKREKLDSKLSELRKEEINIENERVFKERDYRDIRAHLEVLMKKREELMKEITQIQESISEYKTKIERLQEELDKLRKTKEDREREFRENIADLERKRRVREYAVCPYCGASINRDKLEKRIHELEEKISQIREEIAKLEEDIGRKKAYIDELRHICEERLKSAKEELNELNKNIIKLEHEEEKLERELNSYERELAKIKSDIERLEYEKQILDKKLELLRKEKPNVAILIDELRRLQDEESYLHESLDRLRGRRMQLEQMYEDIVVLRDYIEILRLLLEYFKMRFYEIQKITIDEINEAILKHFKLLRLAELEYPILAEGFTFTLTRVGGTPTTLAELSDAEKAILAIVMLLALKERIADDFPYCCIDTLIEFVDDTRAKEVFKYLMEVAKNGKVIIITKTKPYTGEPTLLTQKDILVNEIPI